MSANDGKKKYVSVDVKNLELGSYIPFDCFLYLPKNQKYLQWLKANGQYIQAHKDKLNLLQTGAIMVPSEQQALIEKYIQEIEAARAAAAPVTPAAATVQGGGNVTKSSSGIIEIKEKRVVFGAVRVRDDVVMVQGKVQNKTELIHVKSASAAPDKPKTAAAPKVRVDAQFLNSFIQSTQQAFLEICKANIQFRAPFKRNQKQENPLKINVASFISLVSQTIRGSIGLCFPMETYLYTLAQVNGQPIHEVTPDLYTGSGELMSFIFETARPGLIEQGYLLERAVPTFVAGESLSLPHLIPDPGFSIVFESPGGLFQFEVGIKTGG